VDPETPDVEKVPAVVENFVRQLLVANKAAGLYPPDTAIPRETAEETVRQLDAVLERYPEVTLAVTRQGLYFEEHLVFPGQSAFVAFAVELYHRRLAAVRFHAGVTYRDILTFLAAVEMTWEELAAGGGFEAQLENSGVVAITAVETQVMVVEVSADDLEPLEGAESDPDAAPPEDELGTSRRTITGPRLRDRIEIAHIVGNSDAARDYLEATTDTDGLELSPSGMGRRFSEVARLVAEVDQYEGDSLIRSLAEALLELDPSLQRELLADRLLPEARVSESLGSAVRSLDLEDVCRILASGHGSFDARREGLARALRNLAQISEVDRTEFKRVAGVALQASGIDGNQTADILEHAFPARLEMRRSRSQTDALDAPAAAVLELIEKTPLGHRRLEDAPEVIELQKEADRGITERQLIDVLLAVLTSDTREAEFASTMSALEDQLGVLVVRGEVDVAADAALALLDAAKDPDLSEAQRRRIELAVERFARPDDMRAITAALRLYEPGEPEHEAAQRLLEALGPIAVPVILEQLADEPDRAIRKSLVDLLSRDATRNIPALDTGLSSPHWYFARNVVAILGSTRSPEALPSLERALHHKDPRVRREAIRSLSLISGSRSISLQRAALDDEDAHNVQLAARLLGLRGEVSSVPALESLALGTSRGNRDVASRVEAIEALGRIGSPEALPTLRVLAARRSLLGRGRHREIRAAATAAIDAIQQTGDHEGVQ
jgi:hypothetical protein